MAIGLRQQTQGTFAASSTTTVITIPATTAGDMLVLLIAQAGAGTAVRGVPSDAGVNTWVTPAAVTAAANGPPPVGLITGTNSSIYACYVLNTVAGVTSVTITWAAASKAGVYNLQQWSGTNNALDGSAGSGAATNTTQITPSITTTAAASCVIGAICSPQTATLLQASSSPTSGWNALTGGTLSITMSASYQVMAATGAKSVAYTMGATTPAGFLTLGLAPAAGGPAFIAPAERRIMQAVNRSNSF